MNTIETTLSPNLFQSVTQGSTLVIGGTGSGKTRLLKTIQAEFEKRNSLSMYVTGDSLSLPSRDSAGLFDFFRMITFHEFPDGLVNFQLEDFGRGNRILRMIEILRSLNPQIRITVSIQSLSQLEDLCMQDAARLFATFGCTVILRPESYGISDLKDHPFFNFIQALENLSPIRASNSLRPFEVLTVFEQDGVLTREPFRFNI